MIADSFIPGRGFLYKFDPRPKLLCLVSAVLFFFLENSPAVQLCFLLCLYLMSAYAVGWGRALRPFVLIWPILLLTMILTPPFNNEGRLILSLGGFKVLTAGGLEAAVRMVVRFSGITTAFFIFFSTTETSDFILALRSFGLPYKAALTVTIALRYIPDMFKLYGNISDAHKLRTAGTVKRRGFRHRLSRLFPVLISILIHAVKSIPTLAMALDSKGFGRQGARTSCQKLPPWPRILSELSAAMLFTAACALLILFL